jgi:hypothetical protein
MIDWLMISATTLVVRSKVRSQSDSGSICDDRYISPLVPRVNRNK